MKCMVSQDTEVWEKPTHSVGRHLEEGDISQNFTRTNYFDIRKKQNSNEMKHLPNKNVKEEEKTVAQQDYTVR